MDKQIIAQLIGFVALTLSLMLFQKNNRATMLKLMLIASVLYSVHFFLLGALTGAALNALNAIRSYVYANKNEKKWASHWFWPIIFIFSCVVVCVLTWQGRYSILPALSASLQSVILWSNKTKMIRYLSLTVPPFWLTYNIIVGSIPGIIIEILVFCSVCVAIYRFDISPRQKS